MIVLFCSFFLWILFSSSSVLVLCLDLTFRIPNLYILIGASALTLRMEAQHRSASHKVELHQVKRHIVFVRTV
jgi:hypothetical protein